MFSHFGLISKIIATTTETQTRLLVSARSTECSDFILNSIENCLLSKMDEVFVRFFLENHPPTRYVEYKVRFFADSRSLHRPNHMPQFKLDQFLSQTRLLVY